MNCANSKTIVGYSGFIVYEDCYEYNENACYLADSKDAARQFTETFLLAAFFCAPGTVVEPCGD